MSDVRPTTDTNRKDLPERGAKPEHGSTFPDPRAVETLDLHSFLTQLLRHVPAPIYMTSADNRYLFVNLAWEELFQLPHGQVLGRPIRETVPPQTALLFEETNLRVIGTEESLVEEQLVETATGPRYFHTVEFPVPDHTGKVIGVGGVAIDITEAKRAEAALRDSEARMRCFFDAAFEGIVIHENGTILDANRAVAEMHGYEVHEILGRNVLEFAVEECWELIRTRSTAGYERPYQAVGLRKDGSTFPVEARAKNIVSQGRTVRIVALRDITERKRTEELLQQNAERKQALSRRLLQVQEEERQKLARELHDEIGQVLTGLKLTLELGERLDEEGLRTQVHAARGLVRDLTAQVREMSLGLRPSMLDDLGLLPALLWHFERYTAQTEVRIAFQHKGLGQRFAVEGEITAFRLVQEALTNVARHAGTTEATVRIVLDAGELRLEIEDHGAGFDPEAAQNHGSSCGLTGMRQRVALLGGQFLITSAPGAGTRLAASWTVDCGGGEMQWP